MIEQAGRDTEAHGVVTCGERLSQWSGGDNDSQLCILSDLSEDNTLDDQHRGEAYRVRGRIYRQLVRYDEALADFTRAIDLDPKADWAIASRGVTYRQMGRYKDALTDLTRAIDLAESGWTYYQMALVGLVRGWAHDAQSNYSVLFTSNVSRFSQTRATAGDDSRSPSTSWRWACPMRPSSRSARASNWALAQTRSWMRYETSKTFR